MSVENKRSQICGMSFLPLPDAEVINVPGSDKLQVHGTWMTVDISSGEWKESQEQVGKPIEQELKATVTDTSSVMESQLRTLFSVDGLVLINLTNGDKKVIGTGDFPVQMSMERSGDPGTLTLSFKRSSPEAAKNLTSF